jgi:hypothetical protein
VSVLSAEGLARKQRGEHTAVLATLSCARLDTYYFKRLRGQLTCQSALSREPLSYGTSGINPRTCPRVS